MEDEKPVGRALGGIARQRLFLRKSAGRKHRAPLLLDGRTTRSDMWVARSPPRIGDIELPCYVLEDGTRVLSQAGFLETLGRHRKANVKREGGEERLPAILQGKAINPFISQEILEKSRPIKFRTPRGSNRQWIPS